MMSSHRLLGGGGPSGPKRSGGAAPLQTRPGSRGADASGAAGTHAQRGKAFQRALLPLLFAGACAAEDLSGWHAAVRPLAGPSLTTVGSFDGEESIPWAIGGHAGLRLLVEDPTWSFGVEGTWLSTGLDRGEGIRDALLVGPVAELRMWDVVHLDAGVLAARQMNDEERTYLDLQWSAGFEPWPEERWSPMIVYRSDAIFTSRITTVRSVSLGLRCAF